MKDQPMHHDPSLQRIGYARPGTDTATSVPAAKVCLVIAYLCGGGPMAVGVGTLVLYWITRWEVLLVVGIITILGDLVLWVVGIGHLIAYSAVMARAKVRDRRGQWSFCWQICRWRSDAPS